MGCGIAQPLSAVTPDNWREPSGQKCLRRGRRDWHYHHAFSLCSPRCPVVGQAGRLTRRSATLCLPIATPVCCLIRFFLSLFRKPSPHRLDETTKSRLHTISTYRNFLGDIAVDRGGKRLSLFSDRDLCSLFRSRRLLFALAEKAATAKESLKLFVALPIEGAGCMNSPCPEPLVYLGLYDYRRDAIF